MIDRELLELAAKAAGITDANYHGPIEGMWSEQLEDYWNPLEDDGDALRLAVNLGINIGPESPDVIGKSLARASWLNRSYSIGEYGDGDKYAATRRAIVRAAAEIGRAA